jgi:hypothetical protein
MVDAAGNSMNFFAIHPAILFQNVLLLRPGYRDNGVGAAQYSWHKKGIIIIKCPGVGFRIIPESQAVKRDYELNSAWLEKRRDIRGAKEEIGFLFEAEERQVEVFPNLLSELRAAGRSRDAETVP